MPELHWMHYEDPEQRTGERVLSWNLLGQGKIVFLRHRWHKGERPAGKITKLTCREDPTSFFRRILRRLHVVDFGESTEFSVVKLDKRGVESASPWSVGARNPARFAAYHFEDEFGNKSPLVWVSDAPRGTIENVVEPAFGVTYQGLDASAKFGSHHTIRVWTATKDPALSLQLLLPWQNGTQNLTDFAVEYLHYLAPNLDAEEALNSASDGYLPSEPPANWHISLETDSIMLGADDEKTIEVSVSAPTPGKAAFAVRVVDQENPDHFVVSPIVEVEQTHERLREDEHRRQEEERAEKKRRSHQTAVKKQRDFKQQAENRPRGPAPAGFEPTPQTSEPETPAEPSRSTPMPMPEWLEEWYQHLPKPELPPDADAP